jgi:hypothetical protein
MSINKSWHAIFDVELERRETYAAELLAFERQKNTLLDILRHVHDCGPKKPEPFDEDDAWRALVRAAVWYFKRSIIKQKTLLPARRVERLDDLADALGVVRNLLNKARNDDVGLDLVRGWCAENNIPAGSELIMSDYGKSAVLDEITSAVAVLTALEAAARRAAGDVPTKRGAPGGTGILSLADIINLKEVYRRSTGLEPGTGAGPFVQLVEEFLIATGRGEDTSKDYVVEALTYARKRALKQVREQVRKSAGK